jgi:hypothetical protein
LAKAPLIAPILLAFLYFIFNPTAKEQKKENSLLYSNPQISKAVLGSFSPFVADFAWLESTKIGELGRGGSQNVDKEEMRAAFLTIASLDPSFYHAINYGVSYLATIAKDKKAAYEIIDRALILHPNEFRLKYLKMTIELTSETPNKEMLKKLAVEVFSHPEFNGVFGVMKVDDFLIDILAFAADENAKKAELKRELEWLYKNTKDKNKKELIASRLKELS